MDTLLPFLLVAVVCTAVGWGLVRLRRRVQRRRVGSAAMSAAMSVFDMIWHPAAVDPQIEIQQSYERQAPTPSPEDDENEEDENEKPDARGAGGQGKAAGTDGD